MGNKKQTVESKKRRKKGRPSLLDLQKRSLRLQKQEQKLTNPNPSPNPYLKFPTRRSSRRNPNPKPNLEEEEEEEEEDSSGKRKEKKLKLVLRIPNGSELGGSGSESEGSRKKRKIGDVEHTARQNPNWKATDEAAPQGDPLDSGPRTPLPDKKLLVFILDRLQKKDTYGVFSEPVDPEELPDYHEIIENPMDFGTIRKKLDSGAYENLEQFESDVYLISSNAMRYNASDTIYFRQARSIQELAKKDFENLRQESDDNEEPKTARRGRPPMKNVMKRIGRLPADRTSSDFSSDATLANARDGSHNSNLTRDLLRKVSSFDKPSMMDPHRGNGQHRLERNEVYSGSPLKGIPMRNWKKISVIDESRRNTYNQPPQSICAQEPSILTAFEGVEKFLMPVGLYMEHAYARSLARFAANLGPIGWEIAAKRIERVLPPGMKFGRGWVGDCEPAKNQLHHPPPQASPSSSSSSHLSAQKKPMVNLEPASNKSTSSTTSRPVEAMDGAENGRILSGGGMHRKSPLQVCQNLAMQLPANGFNPGYGFKLPTQAAKLNPYARLPGVAMAHDHVVDTVSRSGESHQAPFTEPTNAEEKAGSMVGNSNATDAGYLVPDSNCSSEVGTWRSKSVNPHHGSAPPPDLNVDMHSPGSPVSGTSAGSKQQQQLLLLRQPEQPELALQL